jgi:membrane-associated phospholipid phosphatase
MASIHLPAALRPRRVPALRNPARGFPGWWQLLVQVLLMGGAALCYFGVRGLTQSSLVPARENARDLMAVERGLGLDWETWLQGVIIDHDRWVDLVNWVYIYGHWPVIGVTLAWLFLRAPDRYYLIRNAMFVSGAIGLVVFALLPVAPPRLGVLDVIDTVTQRTEAYRTLQPPGLINRYAALPSLHLGWNLLVGVILWRTTRNRLVRAFAVAMPVAMAFAVVATGNHYVLDVVAGAVVALAGLWIARMLPALVPTPGWARPPADEARRPEGAVLTGARRPGGGGVTPRP